MVLAARPAFGRLVMAPSVGARLAVATAIALGAGCSHWQPTMSMHAHTADVDLSLEFLRMGAPREFVLGSRSTAPHTILRGWLTVPSRSPCEGGAEVDDIVVDDGRGPPGVLPAGTHRIAVKLLPNAVDYTLDTVADLEIEDNVCLRVPVLSQTISMIPQDRPLILLSSGVTGNPDVSGMVAVTWLGLGLGRWVGPLLLDAQVGAAAAICAAATCGKDQQGNLKSGFALPTALEARFGFGSTVLNHFASAWFAGGRYTFEPIWLPATGGERSFRAHSLQAIIGWGTGDPVGASFRHLERAIPIELDVPLGVVADPSGPNRRIAFTGGVEVRYLFQL